MVCTFLEWVVVNHSDELNEDWKKWARNAALGGALLGTGVGIGSRFTGNQQQVAEPAQEKPQWMKDYGNAEISDQEYVNNHISDESPIDIMKADVEAMKAQLIRNGSSPESVNRMNYTQMQRSLQHQKRIGKWNSP